MQKKWGIIVGLLLISITMGMTGCGQTNLLDDTYEVIFNQDEQVETFYGEGVQRIYNGEVLLETIEFKEWLGKEGQYRMDVDDYVEKEAYEKLAEGMKGVLEKNNGMQKTVVLKTKEDTIIYYETQKTCTKSPNGFEEQVSPALIQGIEGFLLDGSIKKWMIQTLGQCAKEYDVTFLEDDVHIGNFTTQHVIVKTKESSEYDYYEELWIDTSTWLPVKADSIQGDLRIEYEYITVRINPIIFGDVFNLTIPEDVEVIEANSDLQQVTENITLEESLQLLQSAVIYLPESEEEKITRQSISFIVPFDQYNEYIEQVYSIAGEELVVMVQATNDLYESYDYGFEKIQLDFGEGRYYEDNQKQLSFIKDGSICAFIVKNSEISKARLIELANMIQVLKP